VLHKRHSSKLNSPNSGDLGSKAEDALTAITAITLLVLYVVLEQWVFRHQRVGRGILLLAKDSAASYPRLLSALMPTRFVVGVWISYVLWISAAFFAWRAWRWYGAIGVVLYVFVFSVFIDQVSPWPSYNKLLRLIRKRIESGAAGFEAIPLVLYIGQIERQLAAGVHFEKATVGVWFSRSNGATRSQEADGAGALK
jgi:hypothetical protein